VEFVKNLSNSEAKYKYLGLTKLARQDFPKKDEVFRLKFKNKIYDMKVNNKNSIMLTELYHRYQFQENDEVKIISKADSSFELLLIKS